MNKQMIPPCSQGLGTQHQGAETVWWDYRNLSFDPIVLILLLYLKWIYFPRKKKDCLKKIQIVVAH